MTGRLSRFLAVVTVALAAVAAYFGAKYFIGLFEASDSSTKSAVIGALAAVTIAAATYAREGSKARLKRIARRRSRYIRAL